MYECSERCPECGGEVEWDFACHTWPQRRSVCQANGHHVLFNKEPFWCDDCEKDELIQTTWMACMPCDSATRYSCIAHNEERCWEDCFDQGYHEGCGWSWTRGLNPGNPRSVENDRKAPDWDE